MTDADGEALGGRLELTAQRARVLLGGQKRPAATSAEASETAGAPSQTDADALRDLIRKRGSAPAPQTQALANQIIAVASAATERLLADPHAQLIDEEALAIESVIKARGRPAVRIYGERLESLREHPGSSFWEGFLTDCDRAILAVASATCDVAVSFLGERHLRGSAWLASPTILVTNRHVIIDPPPRDAFVERRGQGAEVKPDFRLDVDFACDYREPARKITREIKRILYVAPDSDPVDIAVLAIDPFEDVTPLELASADAPAPQNLYVVGHPGAQGPIPEKVAAVFKELDGRKRASFGQVLTTGAANQPYVHDASTVGGFSGGPVSAIELGQGCRARARTVAGLHYFGDPLSGNLACKANVIRDHPAHAYIKGQQ